MATNNNNQQQIRQQQYRYDPMAAVRAQMAMQGNNGYLLGDIAGSWLGNYLSKLLANLANGKTEDKVNDDTVHQLTQYYGQDILGTPQELANQATNRYEFNSPSPLDKIMNPQTPWAQSMNAGKDIFGDMSFMLGTDDRYVTEPFKNF